MTPRRATAALVAFVALGAASCSKPSTKGALNAPQAGSPFCQEVAKFKQVSQVLNAPQIDDPAATRANIDTARAELAHLASMAPTAQLKGDLDLIDSVFAKISQNLATVPPNDRQAFATAVLSAGATNGKQVNAASSALDFYARFQCGIDTGAPASTIPPAASTTVPTTTGPIVGPVGPSSSTTSSTTASSGSTTTG